MKDQNIGMITVRSTEKSNSNPLKGYLMDSKMSEHNLPTNEDNDQYNFRSFRGTSMLENEYGQKVASHHFNLNSLSNAAYKPNTKTQRHNQK